MELVLKKNVGTKNHVLQKPKTRNKEVVVCRSARSLVIDDIETVGKKRFNTDENNLLPVSKEEILKLLQKSRNEIILDCEDIILTRLKEYPLLKVLFNPIFIIKPDIIKTSLDEELLDPISNLLAKNVSDWSKQFKGDGNYNKLKRYLTINSEKLINEVYQILDDIIANSKIPLAKKIYSKKFVKNIIKNEINQNIPLLVELIDKYGKPLNLPYK